MYVDLFFLSFYHELSSEQPSVFPSRLLYVHWFQ